MAAAPNYNFALPEWNFGLGASQAGGYGRTAGQTTGLTVGGSAPTMSYTTPSQTPTIQTSLDRLKDLGRGLGGKFMETVMGNQQDFNVDTLKNMDMDALKESMASMKLANEAKGLGINPDGTAINTGLLGKAQNFAGSNLAKGLGTALMGAAQLGLGYKSFKEGQKMNKELIKDMRTNRANLAADRARAAKDRETFSHMMNTL